MKKSPCYYIHLTLQFALMGGFFAVAFVPDDSAASILVLWFIAMAAYAWARSKLDRKFRCPGIS